MPTWLLVACLVILVVCVVVSLGFARAAAIGDEQLATPDPERDAPRRAKRFERGASVEDEADDWGQAEGWR